MHTQKEILKLLISTSKIMEEQPYEEDHHKVYADLLLQTDNKYYVDERAVEFHKNWTLAHYLEARECIEESAQILSMNFELLVGAVSVFLNPEQHAVVRVSGAAGKQDKISWPRFWASMEFIRNALFPVDFDYKQVLFDDDDLVGACKSSESSKWDCDMC